MAVTNSRSLDAASSSSSSGGAAAAIVVGRSTNGSRVGSGAVAGMTGTSVGRNNDSSNQVDLDPRAMTDIAEIQAQLRLLNDAESRIDSDLDALITERIPKLEEKLDTLETLRPNIERMSAEAEGLYRVIANTSLLSERISDHVRQLDLQQSRVKASLSLITDLQTLRDCAAGVKLALSSNDIEAAAEHMQAYLQLDPAVLAPLFDYNSQSKQLSSNCNTTTSPIAPLPKDPAALEAVAAAIESGKDIDLSSSEMATSYKNPVEELQSARQELARRVSDGFDDAVATNDQAGVVRFATAFARCGEAATGLDKFASFVGGVVAKLCKDAAASVAGKEDDSPIHFAQLLTQLFESVAGLMDRQEPFIELHFGPGRMLRVMEKLQFVTDMQGLLILDSFSDSRRVQRKIKDITALNQAGRQGKPVPATIQVEPREVDAVITEIAFIGQRTGLFQKFTEIRAKDQARKLEEANSKRYPPELESVSVDFTRSELFKHVRELMSNFITLNEFFMRKSVEKAMQLDSRDSISQTSSVVDDTFYILKSSVSRGLSTGDALTVCSLLDLVSHVLETDYLGWFQKKLTKDFAAIGGGSGSSIGSGGGGATGGDGVKEFRASFMLTLNNVDVSADYIKKLVKDIEAEIPLHFPEVSAKDLDKIRTCLVSISDYAGRFRKIIMTWVENLFSQSVKPRIRTILLDSYKDVKYVLSEQEYMEQDGADPVVRKFTGNFSRMMGQYKKALTERNYGQIMSHTVDNLVKEWETIIMQSLKFNQFGAIRLEKDIRAINSHISSLTTWVMRDKFIRLSQIANLLIVDQISEVSEMWNGISAGSAWRLSSAEAKRVLSLRVDFRTEDIGGLRL